VDKTSYDKTIATLAQAVGKSRIEPNEKDKIFRRLATK